MEANKILILAGVKRCGFDETKICSLLFPRQANLSFKFSLLQFLHDHFYWEKW